MEEKINQGGRGKTRPEQNPAGGEGFGEEKSSDGKTRTRTERQKAQARLRSGETNKRDKRVA
jgi:hypothetical protein